jgi:hypothetical protein
VESAVAYDGPSEVAAGALRLSPCVLRDRTHLVARLADPLATRDALLSLHDVARSELYVSPGEVERRQLDPVITVAPGEVLFESFSLDESTYGRVALRERGLCDVEQQAFGTTNVDFSDRLVHGLEGLRGGTKVGLRVASSGLVVDAGGGARVEEAKIELADSWVHGFLAVQAAIRRPAVRLDLHPGDLRDLLTYLRKRKEQGSPRSLRFRLAPGRAPSVVVEPWNETLDLRRSRHDAGADREVRVWGRRRLLLLQRALPGAKAARALLQGTGLPSFWTVDHGTVAVTLGLSPWTERDWAGLDPLPLGDEEGPAGLVEPAALHLEAARRATTSEVARALKKEEAPVRAALDRLCRDGRALFEPDADDPAGGAWLARRLFQGEPPPPPASAERTKAAAAIVKKGGVALGEARDVEGGRRVAARVKGNGTYEVTSVLDAGGRLLRGACACPFFARLGLDRGACKHLLALAAVARGP